LRRDGRIALDQSQAQDRTATKRCLAEGFADMFARRGIVASVLAASLAIVAAPVRAQDALVTFKSLAPEVALDLARAALAECRKRGFQAAVAVVDRAGVAQVMLRDRFAGPHTPNTAIGKAWTAVSFRTNTTELAAASREGTPQSGVRQVPGAIILGGGMLVEAAGSIVGAVGVSGAPGGDADDACAKAGIDAVRDRLDF
jgi:uncharacterized protein GlcG (DUF336 family)